MNQEIINQEQQETEIDLAELAKLFWYNKWWIILAGIAGGILAIAITFTLIKPTYRSGFVAFINNRTTTNTTEALTNGDTSAAQSLAHTYAAILTSRQLLESAAIQAGIGSKYTYSDIRDAVSTSIVNQTQLINVYATMTDRNDAFALATAIANIAPDYIANIVEGSSMKTATYPVLAEHKHSPSNRKNAVLGAVLGALIAAAFIFIRALLDTRVKSEDELKERFGLPIIGVIPNVNEASGDKSGYAYYYSSGRRKKKGE